MHSLEQGECLSDPNWLLGMEGCHFFKSQHECPKDTAPFAFQTWCFTNLILLHRDLAYALVSTSEPPCFGYHEHTHKSENCSGMIFWSRKASSDAKLYWMKMFRSTWWKPLCYITHCSIILLWSCRPCVNLLVWSISWMHWSAISLYFYSFHSALCASRSPSTAGLCLIQMGTDCKSIILVRQWHKPL